MDIRNRLREFLRRYGRAAVVTLHERLDVIDRQNAEIANTHTALLQSNIHLVEKQAAQGAQLVALRESMDRLEKLYEALLEQQASTRASLESVAHGNHTVRHL